MERDMKAYAELLHDCGHTQTLYHFRPLCQVVQNLIGKGGASNPAVLTGSVMDLEESVSAMMATNNSNNVKPVFFVFFIPFSSTCNTYV